MVMAAEAAGLGAMVVGVVVAAAGADDAVSSVLSPQAAMEKANRVAAVMAVSFVARMG
jgi:hypothetical protein